MMQKSVDAGSRSEQSDRSMVACLLGRDPEGDFTVIARRSDGVPMVIANSPFLRDGTPMPTRFWLVDPELRTRVAALEAQGGVKKAERAVAGDAIAEAHRHYASDRDRLIPATHQGPRPSGGVGGTRSGVKCLHAHLAWWLAGGPDPVGAWVADRLGVCQLPRDGT